MKNTLVVMFVVCGWIGPVWGETGKDCSLSKYQQYAKTQGQWHQDLTAYIARTQPDYTEVAKLMRDDQLHAIERKRLAVEYFLAHQPEKVQTERPLNQWLDLSSQDHERIAQANARYAALRRFLQGAKQRPPHPLGDELRHLMRHNLMKRQDFTSMFRSFLQKLHDIEALSCGD